MDIDSDKEQIMQIVYRHMKHRVGKMDELGGFDNGSKVSLLILVEGSSWDDPQTFVVPFVLKFIYK